MATIRGVYPLYISSFHQRYGDVVRIRPDSLSFCSSQAAKDILSSKAGRGQLQKDPSVYTASLNGSHSILTTPSDKDHGRYRRLLSHGFSDKAIREQETVLTKYIDLLIKGLQRSGKPQDMVAWFNWTTFDIIGDLVFNWSFDCLRNEAYHEWIPFILTSIKTVIISSELCRYPGVAHLLKWMFRSQMLASRQKALAFTADRVSHRITSPTEDRMDFLGYILRHESKETGMSRAEIEATANVLVLAGSETTATLLAGAVYYLIANPHVKQRLMSEIREVFVKEEEITISSVSKLPFLQAVLEEVLRIYPPVTLGSPRLVGYRGAIIAGHVVPPKVRDTMNFKKVFIIL